MSCFLCASHSAAVEDNSSSMSFFICATSISANTGSPASIVVFLISASYLLFTSASFAAFSENDFSMSSSSCRSKSSMHTGSLDGPPDLSLSMAAALMNSTLRATMLLRRVELPLLILCVFSGDVASNCSGSTRIGCACDDQSMDFCLFLRASRLASRLLCCCLTPSLVLRIVSEDLTVTTVTAFSATISFSWLCVWCSVAEGIWTVCFRLNLSSLAFLSFSFSVFDCSCLFMPWGALSTARTSGLTSTACMRCWKSK
mmetsp:Transcript_3061/g.6336  ORF Transcript_3061/g.6336 Transcript_3061/m.6336 type:complete len:258 (+) Transcript_3061:569-1342(+)